MDSFPSNNVARIMTIPPVAWATSARLLFNSPAPRPSSMVLPDFLFDTYRRYKADTSHVIAWLAETAQKYGYALSADSNPAKSRASSVAEVPNRKARKATERHPQQRPPKPPNNRPCLQSNKSRILRNGLLVSTPPFQFQG